MGHIAEDCKSPARFKRCSEPIPHDVEPCRKPSKCPTCNKSDHVAGTINCPIYSSRQKRIKYAYENYISVTEASRLFNSSNGPISSSPTPSALHGNKAHSSLKTEFEDLRSQLASLQAEYLSYLKNLNLNGSLTQLSNQY